MAEKAEVQFKKKTRKKRQVLHLRVLGIRQSVRGLVFAVHCFFFVITFKVRSNGFERTRLRNSVPLVDSMLLKLKLFTDVYTRMNIYLCFMRLLAINCLIVTLLQIRPS